MTRSRSISCYTTWSECSTIAGKPKTQGDAKFEMKEVKARKGRVIAEKKECRSRSRSRRGRRYLLRWWAQGTTVLGGCRGRCRRSRWCSGGRSCSQTLHAHTTHHTTQHIMLTISRHCFRITWIRISLIISHIQSGLFYSGSLEQRAVFERIID